MGKGNPYHVPSGPHGGEFTSGPSGASAKATAKKHQRGAHVDSENELGTMHDTNAVGNSPRGYGELRVRDRTLTGKALVAANMKDGESGPRKGGPGTSADPEFYRAHRSVGGGSGKGRRPKYSVKNNPLKGGFETV